MEWISVAQVVGTIAVPPPVAPGYAAAAMPQFPVPPDLNWGLVLLFDFITCGIFNIAWNLIQALWIKKVQPETKALQWYIVILSIAVVSIFVTISRFAFLMHGHGAGHHEAPSIVAVSYMLSAASLVMNWIVYPFAMRDSLLKHFNESDPIGLELSGVMTFFFGSLYFQYHLNRINEMKRAYRLGIPY
jgi:hypothetical protein